MILHSKDKARQIRVTIENYFPPSSVSCNIKRSKKSKLSNIKRLQIGANFAPVEKSINPYPVLNEFTGMVAWIKQAAADRAHKVLTRDYS